MQRQKPIVWGVILCSLSLLINSCNDGGDNGLVPAVPEPSERSAERAVRNLLDIYGAAMQQEDIDRLQTLLPAEASPVLESLLPQLDSQPRPDNGQRMDAQSFRNTISEDFRGLNILDFYLSIPDEGIDATPEFATATFREVRSVEEPGLLEQRTRVINRTLRLIGSETDGVITFRITEVLRHGPQFEIITPGQILAGIPARITVNEATGVSPLDEVEIEVLDSSTTQILSRNDGMFHGFFTPPMQSDPKPLRIYLRSANQEIVISHRYRLRIPGEGVVQEIRGTTADLSAVAVAPTEAVVAGGTIPDSPFGGTIFPVPAGASAADPFRAFYIDFVDREVSRGLVTDLVFDSLERLHVVLFAPRLRPRGAVVLDLESFDACPTADVDEATYPFLTPEGKPSASTRALTAADGNIWLFGSDGGVARVADTFRDGPCEDVTMEYKPIFRRDTHPTLLTNTVPALVVGSDGTLWFGTALGLAWLQNWLQNDTFTRLPFVRGDDLPENPETLERFFQLIADAIFNAQPILSVAIGNELFVKTFGRPLIKEDLIFSIVEEAPGRLWVGTLGGGLRRVELTSNGPKDTLLLTREDGLSSNIIFALAVEREGVVWVATDEGVSRLQTMEEPIQITNFSTIDGQR